MALAAERKTATGQDLQSFLRFLEEHYPDEVIHVSKEIDPVFEATAALWRLENERRFPAVVFDNIRGSDIPCVTNVHASFPRLAMGIQISETAHGHYIMQKNIKRGQPTQMAVFNGVHPAVELGCLSFTGIDVDEFSIAGAMVGEPLELVKCETIDVEVPAWAEIVLECEIHPTEREPEAPFGEYPGT